MTSIFVFLWLADVSASWAQASSLLIACGMVAGFVLAVLPLGGVLAAINRAAVMRGVALTVAAALAINVLMPSPSTLRLAAAAQAMHLSAQTEIGQNVLAAIQAALGRLMGPDSQ